MSENKGNTAAKASVGYMIGNYCIKGIGFITVPIFARLLSTSDFGIYNTFLAYEGILYIFISLALHSSVKNAKYKFEGEIDKYTSSIAILPVIAAFVFLVAAVVFGEPLGGLLKIDGACIVLLVLYSYCSGLVILYQSRIALDYNYKEYLGMSVFNVLFSVGMSILLICTVFSGQRYMGRILGGTAAYVLLAVYISIKIIKKAPPRVNKEYWKYGLKISLPIIPHGLSQILLLQFDRIMINSMIGSSQAGLYSFSYTIFSLVQITASSLDTVYSPWVFRQMKGEDNKNSIKAVGTCFMLLIAGVVTAVMLLAPEIILLLGGEKYTESFVCLLPVLVSGFFAMAYCIPSVMEYYYEKTKYIALGTTLAAVINIILNAVFIPRFGYVAAAYTTLVSYLLYFLLHTVISRKLSGFFVIGIPYLIGAVIIISSASVTAYVFRYLLWARAAALGVLVCIGIAMIISAYGKERSLEMLRSLGKKGKN